MYDDEMITLLKPSADSPTSLVSPSAICSSEGTQRTLDEVLLMSPRVKINSKAVKRSSAPATEGFNNVSYKDLQSVISADSTDRTRASRSTVSSGIGASISAHIALTQSNSFRPLVAACDSAPRVDSVILRRCPDFHTRGLHFAV